MQNDAVPPGEPCPDDEAARSAALHGHRILDTPRESDFDDLARIASEVCGTPIAVVNLVDTHRQFFKAEVGLGVRETPLETSFCGHAILADEMMIVPDATLDPRFENNPLITGEPRLRFYAGALMKTREGHAIGTLCVLDFVPRQLDAHQIRTLKLLARQAMTQIELRSAFRQREAALAEQRALAARNRKILDSAVDFAIVVTDRGGIVTDWNLGAERIFGWSEAEIVGMSAERLFTREDHAQDRMGVEMALALANGRAADERWHLRKDGSRFWASGEMTPLLGEAGEQTGFVKILRDRTVGHLAGERLRRTEQRLRQAQAAGGVGVFTVEVASGLLEPSPEFSRLFGLDHRERRPAEDFERLVIREDQEIVSHNSTRKVGSSPKDVEYRIRRADDGALRWIARKGDFDRDADGMPLRFTGVAQDVTDRLLREAAFQESERRLRTVVETMPVGVLLAEAPSGRITMSNRRMNELLGQDAALAWSARGGRGAFASFHADGAPPNGADDPLARIADGQEPASAIEVHLERPDGERIWLEVVSEAIRTEAGDLSGAVVVVTDIESRKQAEVRQRLLNHELSHRLKNTLAIVQSIATQTLRTAPDMAVARTSLGARIQALATAHDILLRGSRDAGSVEEVVRGAVDVHDEEGRIEIAGPDVTVGPKAALTLALVCHELATNAGKYGALSVPGGRVDVCWRIEPADGPEDTVLTLDWTEQGGPVVAAPTRRGFGTRLIGMGLSGSAQGSVDIVYDPAGLRCRIVAPLGELVEQAPTS